MNQKLKKALKISSSVLVSAVVVLAILLVGVKVFGLKVYTVLSGSMEPDYPTGSLVYVKAVDVSELHVGDVITYKMGSVTVTHRIIELVADEDDPDNVRFRTKGDANDSVDPLVSFEDVIGEVVFCIPLLGYLAVLIKQPPGLYIAIGVSAVLVALVFVSDAFTDDKKTQTEKN